MKSAVHTIRTKPAFVFALLLGGLLAVSSLYVAVWYNPETRTSTRFDWESAPVTTAALSVTVRSAGPMAHGNHISLVSASFIIASPRPLGPITFLIWIIGDPEAGQIRFAMPGVVEARDDPANSSFGYFVTRGAPLFQEGILNLSTDGDIALRAHLSFAFEDGTWARWSDNAGPSPIVDEGVIHAAPLGDYYAFLGLRVTAASILAAASIAVAPAVEAYRTLLLHRNRSD